MSPYVTECPYCGARLRRRAPKLERQGDELRVRESLRARRRRIVRQRRASRGRWRPRIAVAADRPYATIAAILGPAILVVVQRAGAYDVFQVGAIMHPGLTEPWRYLVAPFVYYQLGGGQTAVLDVGAAPGTDVYAPVDGTIVGISDYILNGRLYGSLIDIQPSAAPSLVVSLTHLIPDPALTVGSMIAASNTKVGRVIDLSGVEKQALSRYTQDAGNHVAIELRPAATLTLP